MGASSEALRLPPGATDVRSRLAWLRARGDNWTRALNEDAARVTVNQQLAESATALNDQSEIGLIPSRPG